MIWVHGAADSSSVIDFTSIIDFDDLYQSYSWLLSCAHEQKTQWTCIMHWVGTVVRRGYVSLQKGTICDARGPCPLIWRTLKPVFRRIWLIRYMLTSRLDAYISRYGDICAHDNNDNDTTDYFTPCTCAQGNNNFMGYTINSMFILGTKWF